MLDSHAFSRCSAAIAGVAVALTLLATPAHAQGDRFTATATNMSTVGRQGVLGQVDIIIQRYSTEDERNRFLAVLSERGPEALLEVFRDAPAVGRLAAPGQLGYEIRYAAEVKGEDGGRRIIIATDRLMSFFESRYQPRTVDYPFTFVQLDLKPDGTGQGRASIYAKLDIDKRNNTVVLENFADQPVMLMNVRSADK